MKNPYCKEALNPPKTDVRKSVTFFEYDALLKESFNRKDDSTTVRIIFFICKNEYLSSAMNIIRDYR